MGVVILFTQPGFAQVQKTAGHDVQTPDRVNVETKDGTATVVSIDYENRTGTLRLPDGTILTFKARGEMSNFDQVKAGDQVLIRK
jgi:hypothetical protein